MRVAITGGFGFLGWHTACRLRALHGVEPCGSGRDGLRRPGRGSRRAGGVDAVHPPRRGQPRRDRRGGRAGQRRARPRRLPTALRADRPVDVVYANSVQAELDNPYGRGKRRAAAILLDGVGPGRPLRRRAAAEPVRRARPAGVQLVRRDVRPRGGRTAGRPTVTGDREVPLLHAQDAAARADRRRSAPDATASSRRRASRVGDRRGARPAAASSTRSTPTRARSRHLDRRRSRSNLFNTYRACRVPRHVPDLARRCTPTSAATCSRPCAPTAAPGRRSSRPPCPGATRGDHYHLHKVERFFVVKGEAEISPAPAAARRRRDVPARAASTPAFVDMPTMWVHNITQRRRRRAGHDVLGRPAARPRATPTSTPRRVAPEATA